MGDFIPRYCRYCIVTANEDQQNGNSFSSFLQRQNRGNVPYPREEKFPGIVYTIPRVFTTEGFFVIAIESWPEWDLNPRPLNPFRRSNRLSYQAMNLTHTRSQLGTATPISSFVQCQISFRLLPSSVATVILIAISYR